MPSPFTSRVDPPASTFSGDPLWNVVIPAMLQWLITFPKTCIAPDVWTTGGAKI